MSSLKPNPPSSTRYLKTYGITSYTSYGGEEYEVYEVVVYTNDTKRSNARYNPLFNWGTMNLLDDGNYTLSDFAETITYKSSYVASLFNIPYALYSTAIPPSAYFGQSVEESLIYEYDATQIFVYAYVAERGVDWYDHMQTSERLSVNSDIVSRINRYGYVEEDDLDDKILRHAESRYYADVSRPTQRYHQNKYKEEFKVGDLKVYYDGDYKGKINTNYYSELWSIPGL
ncbi:hypothetical protein [Maledivibacter halophilus]|uniref:Uncharacterized protein n=1 Tax=Maledivibacter halophilus TaxID=36842 RepID=A0A1T5M9E7_9FIRM|nr:hypothetical protein [Maledivibacter halophilus]SKC84755.1 hypothetical protein SAMN02194393_04204 [Maledivibacter halophilus]